MKKYLPLFVVGVVALSVASANAARVASSPLTHTPGLVYQAYPGSSLGTDLSFRGYLGSGVDVITAVPGILSIDAGDSQWGNFIGAHVLAGIPSVTTAPTAPQAYNVKNVVFTKTTPPYIQCSDVFPPKTITQQGSANIRRWWPLMYEVPGTTYTLNILYGTTLMYDDDGAGPNPPAYVHNEIWTWQVDATLGSLLNLLDLFHELPFGLDEVPLISDESLFPTLVAEITAAQASLAANDLTAASFSLTDFELDVMDACITASPAFPNPTGLGTGIANTRENPACCKLLVDIEYIGKKYNIFQPGK